MTSDWLTPQAEPREPLRIDTSVAHPARVWDYWLGGKENFAADREAGEHVRTAMPSVVEIARADRAFLASTVRYLAGEAGIRQFLDIGTGLPTAGNTHEVAQAVAPESRIVYVDNDPIVLAHARALLTSDPRGATAYIDADLRDTDKILAEAAKTLDFSRPLAVMLLGILLFIPDADGPHAIVARLMDAVPAGSYLAITHGANDIHAFEAADLTDRYNDRSAVALTLRSKEEFTRCFNGLDLVEPGVVPLQRPGPKPPDGDNDLDAYCGLARKPDD